MIINEMDGTPAEIDSAAASAGEGSSPESREPLNAVWETLLPILGVQAMTPGEAPAGLRLERGPDPGEATLFLEMRDPGSDQEPKTPAPRVLGISVKLGHDYRRLGDRYYCVDCEHHSDETRH